MHQSDVFLVRPRISVAEERASYPLNLVTVFSSLKSANVNARMVDIDFLCRQGGSYPSICEELLKKIALANMPIVGISANDANLPEILHLAGQIKKRRKSGRIILGGPGVYFNSSGIMSKFGDVVDYIVRGEAEHAFPTLVASILSGQKRAQAHRIINSSRVACMDDYAFPRYDKLDPKAYRSGALGVEYIPLLVGAGCRHQCKYCSTSNFWGHQVRYKSVERVIKEIRFLDMMGITKIDLVHDNFFADMDYVARFSEALLRQKINISWVCAGRADDFDIATAPLLARAGCKSVFWGIESGSESGLRIINKKIHLGKSVSKVREVTTKHNIDSIVSFVYNFPGDRLAYFEETLELALRLKSECQERIQVALNSYLALSGSVFAKKAALSESQYLLRQIDFDPQLRRIIRKNPALFSFFFKPKDVTKLNEEFRFKRLNWVLNSFPKTFEILLKEYSPIEILRRFQKKEGLKASIAATLKRNKSVPARLLDDVYAFEYLSSRPPANAPGQKTYELLETFYDVPEFSAKAIKSKKQYLFFYHNGKIDTFEVTPGNFRRFQAAAKKGIKEKRKMMPEIEKNI